MDEGGDYTGNSLQTTYIQRFYEKLSEVFSQWIPLEDVYYRNIEFGELEFGKVSEMAKWPDLGFFNITIAKNGGPIAFMLQDKVLMIGGLKDIKSVAAKLKVNNEKLKWACFEFTQDEDLLLITTDGYAYLIDPKTGEFKDKPVLLGAEFAMRPIQDAKLFENILVFRNSINQFYWIPNITQSMVASKFDYIAKLQDAQIHDYIIIPKGTKGASALELLIPDPEEGFHVIKENKGQSMYLRDLSQMSDDRIPFGKIQFMALNSKKDLLALYTEAETKGRIIVMKSNYQKEFNRFDTRLLEANALQWCGNDAPVLTFIDKIAIVGPQQFEILDFRTKTAGIKVMNEIDGLRIVSSEKTYFLERVQPVLLKSFKIASISPSAKLLNAIKSVDLNIPRADEIIRELGKDLITGIEDLLEAATMEHQNITVLKHLLRTASFAKTFVDPTEYDSNKDYKLALQIIEQLNLKHASMVYEEWCQTMVKYSTLQDNELEIRLQEKFDQLKIQIAEEQGINLTSLSFQLGINAANLPTLAMSGGRTGSMMPSGMTQTQQLAHQLGNNIKLNIDFTKLAKIADSRGKKRLANFLIQKEKSIVKKIPFLLEAQQYEEALNFAMEGGDPNIINKVFSEILKKFEGNNKQVIQKAASIPDGLRHLRNFARARKDENLLSDIAIMTSSLRQNQNQVQDMSGVIVSIKNAYENENIENRLDQVSQAMKKIGEIYKDDFYGKTLEEMLVTQSKQRDLFRTFKDQRLVDASLSDTIALLIAGGKEKEKDVKELKNTMKIPEKYYFMMAIRGFAKANNWDDLYYFINHKKPPVTYSFLAELCIEYGKVPMAVEAIKKISDYDEKIPMLIDITQWREAIEESFNGKRMEFLDEIRQKGPAFVEDFIREEMVKRGTK
ncbi:vacuolar assembling sorting protein vps16 [Stylonychia lemnae]|uniref:Vacuolar assembling sorting protein vps16 n=1 Tax=Stylonychia lemnae TaxID=5949 RepID=A0A078AG66_STYLE|nr:vacuolar assembling sorting protein vps16 [Stylonychia lemnae]|eukprot:CDW81219.1 vacuolar assembling sorting protein vps16 [Stylonychia lemnae]